ncbi:MAG: MFS transporter, partial [Candidatus Korarchaeota archaeon]
MTNWKKSFTIFLISLFLVNLFDVSMWPYKVIYFQLIGISPSFVGTIIAVASIVTLPFMPVGGILGDRIGRKRVLVVTPFLSTG